MGRLKLIAELAKKRRRAERLAAGVERRELYQEDDIAGAAIAAEPDVTPELDFS